MYEVISARDGYEINIDGRWVHVEDSAALDKLGNNYAVFSDIETIFFTLPLIGLGDSRFCSFSLPYGDRLFARQASLIKHTYEAPRFRYLICPADILDTDASMQLERGLGNNDALLIGN